MTSLDIRNNSAVMKRAEQLKRWEESDTNQQPPVPRPDRGSRIKFSSGCIFLAACLAGDKEEVLKLLEQGADINTANVDGLTALHQACIDDNLEMVEFLVEQGADINRQDNEGWTPLHATASCGFVSIARYLVEHGADVAAVNSDGDLAVDLAVDIQHLPMIDFMQKMVAEQQIDCAKARQAEQQQMLADAKKWLRSDAAEIDRPHPKTGATALHVAAAKGYTKVLSLLLAGRANVDAQDNDGWTPLHAAAHWGQKEAAQMLLDAMADMDAHNYAGQTCIDVADRKMVKYLEEYRANNKRIKRRPSSQISRISDTIENHMDKTPPKIIRVEVRPDNNKDHPNDDKTSVQKTTNEQPATEDEAPWRRNNVARVRTSNDSPSKNQVPDVIDVNKTTTATPNAATTETTDVILRRTQSFENDEKKSPPVSPAVSTTPAYTTNTTNTTASPAAVATPIRRSFVPPVRDEESETQRKAHAKRVRETRRSTQGVTLDEIKSAEELVKKKNSSMNNNNNNNSSSFKLEDANAGNTYPPTNSTIIPSAPAVIAAANSMSQRRINNVNNAISSSNTSLNSIGRPVSAPPISNLSSGINTTSSNNTTSSATTTATSSSNNQKSDDKTTDNSSTTTNTTSSSGIGSSYSARRASANTSSSASSTTALNSETSSAASAAGSTSSTATSLSNNDDKDNDKENDNRSALATQAVIQRRRKPKRRSTGVVHIDMDELDPEKQDSANDNEEKDKEKESGSENRASRSRAGSTVSVATSTSSATDDKKTRDKTESSGDNIDYKALWEAVKLENEKLRAQLKKKDDEVIQTRATLERFANATNKNSLSEIEKRERRAMERKLSELEEELKQLDAYKTENLRLKEENGALIRVISKLSK
uniref:Protein phosphatase 1 regulatory subunit 12B n=1 Tax=Musca domestica TaxID=7370 RepID=T1PLK6_MUSDO